MRMSQQKTWEPLVRQREYKEETLAGKFEKCYYKDYILYYIDYTI